MSFQALTAVAPLAGLEPGEKLLLFMMANYAGADHTLFPAQRTLAFDTGMSERTVLTHMKRLEARGLIRRSARYGLGSRKSDLIELLFIPANIAPIEVPKPANPAFHTCKKQQFIPATVAEEPVIESVKEPKCAREVGAVDAASRALVGGLMKDLVKELGGRRA